MSAEVLLAVAEVAGHCGLNKGDVETCTPINLFKILSSSWFYQGRSSETLMYGTVNEDLVLKTLCKKLFFVAILMLE